MELFSESLWFAKTLSACIFNSLDHYHSQADASALRASCWRSILTCPNQDDSEGRLYFGLGKGAPKWQDSFRSFGSHPHLTSEVLAIVSMVSHSLLRIVSS